MVSAPLTDRTKQSADEALSAVATNHQQVGALGLLDQHRGRMATQYPLPHSHAGVCLARVSNRVGQ